MASGLRSVAFWKERARALKNARRARDKVERLTGRSVNAVAAKASRVSRP